MPEAALLALTWRITRRRLLASPAAVAAGLLFPAFIVWLGVRDGYATAAKFFFFLLPHVFLISAQDTVRSDVESGALENVLFLGGRFRGFLAARSLLAAAAAAGYAACLFGLFAAWGAVAGGLAPDFAVRFALALVAGLYYVALAGALSFLLKGGSNVLAVLLAQSAVVIGLILSVSSRPGLLDHAAAGRFPGLGSKLLFGGLAAVLPNVIAAGRPSLFAVEIAALLAAAALVQHRLGRRLELRK